MFDIENFSYIKSINPFEWIMLAIYCIVIFAITFGRQVAMIGKNPLYRYFTWAVFAKIVSSVVFCLIYIYYYEGGDTVSYYESARALVNLAMKDIGSYFDVMTSSPSLSGYMTFDRETGYPWPYMYFDKQTFFVSKAISPIVFASFKSYLVTSILLAWLSFFGVWKFFLTLCRYFPGLETRLAIGVLFVPSVLFWGSGILKDTITFSTVCWFIVGIDYFVMQKKNRITNGMIILVSLYILLSVKPYILYSLFPGTLIWIGSSRMKRIDSKFIRFTLAPIVIVLSIALGYVGLSILGSSMGKFSVSTMIQTAAETQHDLKQDYYEGSSFDIGDFEPTITGMLSKVPAAMAVGLFRPYVWEARNVGVVISGIENFIYLLLVVFLLFKIIASPRKFFKVLGDFPILTFLLCYTLFFSVMVGLSTSNFGALVRFKIPFMSCYVALILILHYFLSDQGAKAARDKLNASRNNPSMYRPTETNSTTN